MNDLQMFANKISGLILGPVKDSQFIFSMYNANNKMIMGIKVSPYQFAIDYDQAISNALSIRHSNPFHYSFTQEMSYTIALVMNAENIQFSINCEELHISSLEDKLFEEADIFGSIHIGAGDEAGNESMPQVYTPIITTSRNTNLSFKLLN